MSTTIFYAEHAVSLLNDDTERIVEGPQWAGGWYGSTIFTSFFPINPQGKVKDEYGDGLCRAFIGAVSSGHPGGANAAFVDGSVKFIKDTIDSWPVEPSTATPLGVTRDKTGLFQLAPKRSFTSGRSLRPVLATRSSARVVSDHDGGPATDRSADAATSRAVYDRAGLPREPAVGSTRELSTGNPARGTEQVTSLVIFTPSHSPLSSAAIVARSPLQGENRGDRDVHDDRIHSGGFADGLGTTPGRSGRY